MTDNARRFIADAPIPWDEVRERRVLGRVEEAIERSKHSPKAAHRPPTRTLGRAVAVFAAAASIALAVWAGPRVADTLVGAQEDRWIATRGMTVTLLRQDPPQQPATMALADGSIAHLHHAARVDVDVQTEDLVRLLQRSGVVRYEVAPNPARRFVVDAQGVEVRVVGTIFTVEVAADHVRVEVERGRVAVENFERVAELGAGDELRLDKEPEETLVIVDDEPASRDHEGPRHGASRSKPIPDVETLLARADRARVKGQLAEAAAALSELVRRYPRDPRTYSSYFALGKVERARRHHGAAASAFSACYKRAPAGALSEDARAEAAVSWLDAGQKTRSAKAARNYLDRYPKGAHEGRMKRIVDRTR